MTTRINQINLNDVEEVSPSFSSPVTSYRSAHGIAYPILPVPIAPR